MYSSITQELNLFPFKLPPFASLSQQKHGDTRLILALVGIWTHGGDKSKQKRAKELNHLLERKKGREIGRRCIVLKNNPKTHPKKTPRHLQFNPYT